jgi:hypothetical protein
MFNDLLILSSNFEKAAAALIKNATINSDMAIRIMHSIVPTVTEGPDEAKNAQTLLTEKHLLSVAERYMKRAARIIVEELYYSSDKNPYLRANTAYRIKNYLSAAKIGAAEFSLDHFPPSYGGKRWAQFSEGLVKLGTAIKKFHYDLSKNNTKEIEEGAGYIAAYMNYLDGLTHNTGSFLDKMLRDEVRQFSKPEDIKAELLSKRKDALKLMDAKQLSHVEDIVPFIKMYISGNPDAYLYKEFYSKLSNMRPDQERIEREMASIREKKNMISNVDMNIDIIINDMQRRLEDSNYNNVYTYYKFLTGIGDTFGKFNSKLKDNINAIIQKYNFDRFFKSGSLNIEDAIRNHFDSQDASMYNNIRVNAQESVGNKDKLQSNISNIFDNTGVDKVKIVEPDEDFELSPDLSSLEEFVVIVDNDSAYFVYYTLQGDCIVKKLTVSQLHNQYADKNKVYVTSEELISLDDSKNREFLELIIKCTKEVRNYIVGAMNLGLPEIK